MHISHISLHAVTKVVCSSHMRDVISFHSIMKYVGSSLEFWYKFVVILFCVNSFCNSHQIMR